MIPPAQKLQVLRDWRSSTKPVGYLMVIGCAAGGGAIALCGQAMVRGGSLWTPAPISASLLLLVCAATCFAAYVWMKQAREALQRKTGYRSLASLLEEDRP